MKIKNIIIMLMVLPVFISALPLKAEKRDMKDLNSIVATDVYDRKVKPVAGLNEDKYVGLFYFAWHNAAYHTDRGVQTKTFDITKMLRETPDLVWNTTDNIRKVHYFNEPLYGYYNSSDPWVIRKHIEMFIAAGVDFIAYDFTNYTVYWDPLFTMLDLLNEYYEKGWDVPQVMFFTKKDCANQIPKLYERIYEKNLYPHLWFKAGGEKPYLIAIKEDIPESLWDYFELRHPFWPKDEFRTDGWPYVDFERPLRQFGNLMNVSVAQHTDGAFSYSVKNQSGTKSSSWGRGYTKENPVNGNIEAIEKGENIEQEWDYAIKASPEIVFVTGWNEWIAPKIVLEGNKIARFVDSFNNEFSRDIEMTKAPNYIVDENGNYIQEGYGDNYYIQLVRKIREYKGIDLSKNSFIAPTQKQIDISQGNEQWDGASTYMNISTQKTERNYDGFSKDIKYTQSAPENFIKQIKVTNDEKNIYFLIETDSNITPFDAEKTNWMNLYIGVADSKEQSWESYQYVINRSPMSSGKTSLEKSTGGFNFAKVQELDFAIKDNIMQIEIPISALGIKENSFSIHFKVTDSIEKPSDILDYYVSGCSVPLGRLSYSYTTSFEASSVSQPKDKGFSFSKLTVPLVIAAYALITTGCVFIVFNGKSKRKNEKN